MSEIWKVRKNYKNSYDIISSHSKWCIAENLLEKQAILICKLFNDSQN